ncbi:hypothetical protein GmHk_15G042661 [Glycine max]|nr:hypothetical protein GmHk_15G042661 [Glycine max]
MVGLWRYQHVGWVDVRVGVESLAVLFSGCPNLEDMEATGLCFKSYVVEAKTLVEKDKHIIPLEVVCNVQFLSIKWELNTLFVCHFFLLRKKMRIYDIFFVGICTLHMDNQEVEIIEDFLEFHNLTHIEFSYVECTRD